jgi:hypothetical protein
MQKNVIEELTADEVEDIISSAESDFGLFPGTVAAKVAYDITGTVDLDYSDSADHSEEEMISALQHSIADALNIHISDVEVIFDPESGQATYTISSNSVEEASR